MADTFFGFDTSISIDDDAGGGCLVENEEDYDALNSETFDSAIKGDWENTHENLVLLDQSDDIKEDENDDNDSDLEINFARVGMDDFDMAKEDTEGRIQLDPSVWAPKPESNDPFNFRESDYLRSPYSVCSMLQQPPVMMPQQNHQPQHVNNLLESLQAGMPTIPPPHKIISVEDIERSIRNQQKQTPPKFEPLRSQTPQHQRTPQQLPFTRSPSVPPGLPPPKAPLFPAYHSQLPTNNNLKPIRLPPGFPPSMQLLGQHGLHMNGMPRPMSHNLPVALNNFAMHPHFNVMRGNSGISLPNRLPAPNVTSPHYQQNVQNIAASVNQFNQRLVQEIQQNHPMLPFNRLNNNFNNHPQLNHMQHSNNNNQINNGMNNKGSQMQQMKVNGNMNEEYDEYANLMSKRDKQWLITIQLSQLNTGTPYIDDYYYTVFKERKSKLKGERENKAHKDNQLNHPFSQPKGHAQLVIMSIGNKNGMNQRNGQNSRERKNSESNKDKEQTPRTYTPLQFENSLGKLQCGSVTAPRKIIDMDVVGPESSSPFTTSIEISAQRKSRQILMHIETLYRIVLKLEDLENPTAIATFLILKERREKERLAALEQQLENMSTNKDVISSLNLDSSGNSVRSSLSITEKEDEGRDELLPKLLAGLASEKVAQMMTIRKGKTLLRRIMPLIKNSIQRWDVWYTIFSTLPLIVKKEKDDPDGLLFAMFPEFKNQVQNGSITEVVKMSNSFVSSESRLSYLFKNKFYVSCIIVLILRAEYIFNITDDKSVTSIATSPTSLWLIFLTRLTIAANKFNQIQTNGATIQNDIYKTLVNHFSRYRDLKSQQLLAILTQDNI